MSLSAALRLGRVSNLPTVWSNALAGFALAGGFPDAVAIAGTVVALSLLYVAGMYLNDAFDREIDARERPGRPIPAGEAAPGAVFTAGFAMMGAALALLGWLALRPGGGAGWTLPATGALLAAAILFYDRHHKGNPWSPAVMGLCRLLAYATAALTVAPTLPPLALAAGLAMLCYLVGLTHAARGEAQGRLESAWPLALLAVPVVFGLWLLTGGAQVLPFLLLFAAWTVYAAGLLVRRGPSVPKGIAALIAGIALFDAVLVAALAPLWLAALAAAAFPLTLALQRRVPGT